LTRLSALRLSESGYGRWRASAAKP
jgi:hypothetical protein